jgi:hypothetical protein
MPWRCEISSNGFLCLEGGDMRYREIVESIEHDLAAHDLPDKVKAAVLRLYHKVAHNTRLCGDSIAVDGFWIETHTLGCRNAADDPEDQWQARHAAIHAAYADDGTSVVLGDPDGVFVTVTPQRQLTERTETVEITSRGGNNLTVRLHWNPTAQELLNLVKRSEDAEQRGLLIDAKTAVFWDSWYAEHDRIVRWLNQQGYEVPMDGENNIVINGRSEIPVLYASDEVAATPVIKRLMSTFKHGD